MNGGIKVEKKNEQGKRITKEISKELLALYLSVGWNKAEEKKVYKPIQSNVENE